MDKGNKTGTVEMQISPLLTDGAFRENNTLPAAKTQ